MGIRPTRARKSMRRNGENLRRSCGGAIVFADFDSPGQFAELGKELLLPNIPLVTHHQARSASPARMIELLHGVIHGPSGLRAIHSPNPQDGGSIRMPCRDPLIRGKYRSEERRVG